MYSLIVECLNTRNIKLCNSEGNLIAKACINSIQPHTTVGSRTYVVSLRTTNVRRLCVVSNINTNCAPTMIKASVIRVKIVPSTTCKILTRKHVIRKLCYDYLYGFCKEGPDCKMVHVKLFNNRDVRNELKFTEQLYKLLKDNGPYSYIVNF